MKKIILLALFILVLSGCSLSNDKTIGRTTQGEEDGDVFYFSNVITNPFNNDYYFVVKDTGSEKGYFCLTKFGDPERIILDECKKVGSYCGNNTDDDSNLCLLAHQEKDKKWEPVVNLFFPANNKFCNDGIECARFDGKNGMPGAELLKFSTVSVVDILYSKNINETNYQEIRQYDIENDKLSEPILYYNFANNQSYYAIGNQKGFLLFLNDIKTSPILWGPKIQSPGMYFIEDNFSSLVKINKLSLPGKYNHNDKLSVDFDIRNDYENNNIIEFVIKDYGTKYHFNFTTKKIDMAN